MKTIFKTWFAFRDDGEMHFYFATTTSISRIIVSHNIIIIQLNNSDGLNRTKVIEQVMKGQYKN